jgi:hypothetical protein
VNQTIGWLVLSLFSALAGGVLWAALAHRTMPAGSDRPQVDRDS